MDYNKNLRELRKKFGISQEELAERLEISRPTLIKIENAKRKLTKKEEKICDLIFKFEEDSEKPYLRINIPQQKLNKFEQVLLYILHKVGGKANVGETVLYKLLYFIDFDYYEKYEEQLMGLTYIKNQFGPTPREFKKVIEDMVNKGELEVVKSQYFSREQRKYLTKVIPNIGDFNGRELEIINSVLERYSDKSASELSRLSHLDTPWRVAKMGEDIEYEHAFYRPDAFSVREYEPL